MNTYRFNLKSTRMGPFVGQTDDGPDKVVERAKSVYKSDLEYIYLEVGEEKIFIYTADDYVG